MANFDSIDAYQAALKARAREILSLEKEIAFNAAQDVNQKKADRIFIRGLNANGRNIGTYSTKPIRISQKNSPRQLGGKTKYFAGGYKDFKQFIGRGAKVNLVVFRNLERDFRTSLTWRSGEWTEGVKRNENVDKIGGILKKYGDVVFEFSKTEIKNFNKLVEQVLNRKMKGN